MFLGENTIEMDSRLIAARTVESLTNAMVSNIIGEVTRRENVAEKNLIEQEHISEGAELDVHIARNAQQKLIKCENICIKLSWLQLAALKSLAVLLGCNKFLELLLLTDDDEGKTGHLASYSDKEELLSIEQEKKELSDNVFLKDALKFVMRLLVKRSVEPCKLSNIMTVGELERVLTILQSTLLQFEAEDNFHISETQNKIKSLTNTTSTLSSMAANVLAQNQQECLRLGGGAHNLAWGNQGNFFKKIFTNRTLNYSRLSDTINRFS